MARLAESDPPSGTPSARVAGAGRARTSEALAVVPASAEAPARDATRTATPGAPPAIRHYVARAGRVVDGDTLYLHGLTVRVRLWGVDAPESDETGYDAATRKLTTLVEGRVLSCEEVDRDNYGRIVARCFTGEGVDISRAMIKSGLALEYMRFTNGFYSKD